MENILIPTDFSATASNAVRAGFDLAVQFGANLHLYSCIDIPESWPHLSEIEKTQEEEYLQCIHNTEQLFKEWETMASSLGLTLSTSWSGGKFIRRIQEVVDKNAIDFIVMGSHGASGKKAFFIGSNTQYIVRIIHCPVLVIKEDIENYQVDKVIFASNFDEKEKRAFQYFLDFTAPLQAEIHLVSVNTAGWFGQPSYLIKEAMKDFAALCGDRPCKIHFVRDSSIDFGIRYFANKIGADLIGISNQQRHPLKRMLSGSNVEILINHAKIPVLSIDFPKITKTEKVKNKEDQQTIRES